MVDTKRYNDWFNMALKDLKSAEILHEHDADSGIVCFHCQQAIEKYLKGYLIYKTGLLQDGHNLVKLCRKATSYSQVFKNYLKDCAFINTFYIETRYPAEESMIVLKEDAEESIKITKSMISDIDALIED